MKALLPRLIPIIGKCRCQRVAPAFWSESKVWIAVGIIAGCCFKMALFLDQVKIEPAAFPYVVAYMFWQSLLDVAENMREFGTSSPSGSQTQSWKSFENENQDKSAWNETKSNLSFSNSESSPHGPQTLHHNLASPALHLFQTSFGSCWSYSE